MNSNTKDSLRRRDRATGPRILVCIPAYNEAANIASIIERAANYASEVIVYDDGSADNTAEVAKHAGAIVISDPRNRGYGAAISTLFSAARERNVDIMVTLDSDGQHNPDEIPQIIEPLFNRGTDIVIGSRYLVGTNKQINKIPSYRNLG